MTHDEITELLGAYALDAVSPEEAAEIEQHLTECPRCRAEVTAHREVAGVLGNLGGSAPAGLWSRIADELAIGSEGPLRPSISGTSPLARPTFGEIAPAGGHEDEDADEDEGGDSDRHGRTPAAPAPVISIDSARQPGSVRTSRTDGSGSSGRRRRTVIMTSVAALAAALAIVVGVLSSRVVSLDHRVNALSTGILAGGVQGSGGSSRERPEPRHPRSDEHDRLVVGEGGGVARWAGVSRARHDAGDRRRRDVSGVGGRERQVRLARRARALTRGRSHAAAAGHVVGAREHRAAGRLATADESSADLEPPSGDSVATRGLTRGLPEELPGQMLEHRSRHLE